MSKCKIIVLIGEELHCDRGESEINVFDALYRAKKGEVEVIDASGRRLGWFELARRLSMKDENLWIMFAVYYDLRERGRRAEHGPFQNSFTLYMGGKPKMLVFVTEETVSFPSKKIVEWLEASRKMGREAVIAIVDKHGEVSYYTLEKFG